MIWRLTSDTPLNNKEIKVDDSEWDKFKLYDGSHVEYFNKLMEKK